MTRVVVQVRCHDAAEKVRWEAMAAARGLSLSALVRVLIEGAALEEREGSAEIPVSPDPPEVAARPSRSSSVVPSRAEVERVARSVPGVTFGDLVRPARPDPRG